MAGVLPGREEEAHLPHLQAAMRRRPPTDPPLLPIHRRVPHADRLLLPLAARAHRWRRRPGGARRRGRAAGAEGRLPRQGARRAARRDPEAQRRGERCCWPPEFGWILCWVCVSLWISNGFLVIFGSGCYVEGEGVAAKVMKELREKECVHQLLNAKTEVESIDLDSAR